ncbi:39S ribosomal protein L3, mitochondrial [Nephila pilipes]|uniref:Large ribosomal subunit protein uL3m n=1 Tax=Nephila pilipes TaxID=299642 RepID=A0A8X6T4H8_NEPPI|nr:39S ribosomal protein L3, mitochondrial [Nephila pilipes]
MSFGVTFPHNTDACFNVRNATFMPVQLFSVAGHEARSISCSAHVAAWSMLSCQHQFEKGASLVLFSMCCCKFGLQNFCGSKLSIGRLKIQPEHYIDSSQWKHKISPLPSFLAKYYGFQGVVKRYGFKGEPATYGCTKNHRRHGCIGGGIWRINTKYKVLYVRGPAVPGVNENYVTIYDSYVNKKCHMEENPPPFPTFYPEVVNEPLLEDIYDEDLHDFSENSINIQEEETKKS